MPPVPLAVLVTVVTAVDAGAVTVDTAVVVVVTPPDVTVWVNVVTEVEDDCAMPGCNARATIAPGAPSSKNTFMTPFVSAPTAGSWRRGPPTAREVIRLPVLPSRRRRIPSEDVT